MITFLMIYWPKRVRLNGACVNTRSGKKRKGKKVKIIWIKASFKANFTKRWLINSNPIVVSQIASRIIDNSGVRIPNVSCSIVALARSSAGLTPTKYLSIPNQRYTMPILTQIKFIFVFLCIKRATSSFIFVQKKLN